MIPTRPWRASGDTAMGKHQIVGIGFSFLLIVWLMIEIGWGGGQQKNRR